MQADSMLAGDRLALVAATAALGVSVSLLGGASGWLVGALIRRWRPIAFPFAALGAAGTLIAMIAITPAPNDVPRIEAPTPTPSAATDVVLITLDTFRADHLSAIGGAPHPVQTPHLDALAESGALFTQGVTPVPLTLPAHAAMLTGRAPPDIGVFANGHRLRPDASTIAEILRDAGSQTAAFISAGVLRRATGIHAGFAHFDDRLSLVDRLHETRLGQFARRILGRSWRAPRRSGDSTVRRALKWWAATDSPRFMWVHLYDPHAPYAPPPPYDTMYPHDASDAPGNPDQMAEIRAGRRPGLERFTIPIDTRGPIARYAGEVSWTDALVGRLIAGIDPLTPLIVAADHGESLTEHANVLSHGSHVYQASVRIPILIRSPLIAPGTRIDTPVSARDIAGAIAHLAGHAPSPSRLVSIANGTTTGEPEITSFAPKQQSRKQIDMKARWRIAYRQGPVKWIGDQLGRTQRYVLTDDPDERNDTAPMHPDAERISTRAKADLHALRKSAQSRSALFDPEMPFDPEMKETLEALGYVQ